MLKVLWRVPRPFVETSDFTAESTSQETQTVILLLGWSPDSVADRFDRPLVSVSAGVPPRRVFPASTPVERPLENSKVRLLEKLPIAVRIGDEVVTVDRQDDGTLGSECNSVSVNEFLRFYLELDVGPQIMLAASENLGDAEGLKTLAESFVAWLGLNEPRGEDGRLKKAVTCIGYRDPDEAQGRFVLQRCAQRTRNVTGLCRFHDDPHSYTLWNCDPQEVNPLLEKALNEKMEWVNAERVRRESKWKRVASRITYTATDRQIYLLLDLGEEPAYLEGIDNRAASILIGVMLEEAGSVRFDEKPDPGYYF